MLMNFGLSSFEPPQPETPETIKQATTADKATSNRGRVGFMIEPWGLHKMGGFEAGLRTYQVPEAPASDCIRP